MLGSVGLFSLDYLPTSLDTWQPHSALVASVSRVSEAEEREKYGRAVGYVKQQITERILRVPDPTSLEDLLEVLMVDEVWLAAIATMNELNLRLPRPTTRYQAKFAGTVRRVFPPKASLDYESAHEIGARAGKFNNARYHLPLNERPEYDFVLDLIPPDIYQHDSPPTEVMEHVFRSTKMYMSVLTLHFVIIHGMRVPAWLAEKLVSVWREGCLSWLTLYASAGYALPFELVPAKDRLDLPVLFKEARQTYELWQSEARSHAIVLRNQRETPWLGELYSMVKDEKSDDALDLLFEKVDDLLVEGRMEQCDRLLKKIDEKRLDTSLLVGVLSITLPAKTSLKERPSFFERAKTRLQELAPGRSERLLSGLN